MDGQKKGSGFYTRSMNGLLFPVIFSPAVLSTLSCPVMITLIILSPAVDSQHFNNERWKRPSRFTNWIAGRGSIATAKVGWAGREGVARTGQKKGSGFYTRSMNGLLFPVIFSPAVLSTLSCPVMITLIILSPCRGQPTLQR